ncbi:hypothetical protein BJ993_001480 [Nocardioides aromaticivorans]|uniref:Uncharacterized protein n=1 Tax=Nocardioides aromaticivorans TaxID=200618 RepID=A0A7Z0CN04_9ACTN|nr:hypothetical protein [Nocardioides aromaticivorans]NYI44400.1 hypothetical protein [Nocardioides aromaticivorans]
MPTTSRRFAGLSPLVVVLAVLGMLAVGTGGAVAGALITGAQIKNGTVTGVDIKDNSLTSTDVLDETRVWGKVSTATGPFTSSTWTPVVSRSLTVSKAGFLQVTGDLYAEDLNGTAGLGSLFYSIKIDGKVINLGNYRRLQYASENSENHGANGSATVTVPVAKGTHTVALVVRETSTGSYLYGGSINAAYAPVGSGPVTYLAPRTVPRSTNH